MQKRVACQKEMIALITHCFHSSYNNNQGNYPLKLKRLPPALWCKLHRTEVKHSACFVCLLCTALRKSWWKEESESPFSKFAKYLTKIYYLCMCLQLYAILAELQWWNLFNKSLELSYKLKLIKNIVGIRESCSLKSLDYNSNDISFTKTNT